MNNPGDKPDAEITKRLVREAQRVHYWTGRGTLCSLDNNVTQQPNHTDNRKAVTCKWCIGLLSYSAPACRCGHSMADHMEGFDFCTLGCGCDAYREPSVCGCGATGAHDHDPFH